jgi:hypothetical protein
MEKIEVKAFSIFIRIYSLFKNDRLNASIKLTLHKTLIRSIITCCTWELVIDTKLLKLQVYKTRFSAPMEIFEGAHWSENCTRLSTFHIYAIIQQNCSGDKHKSYKIMRMDMFAVQDKAKPDTENIRGLNLAVVKLRPFM